jgi:hypothetical protein
MILIVVHNGTGVVREALPESHSFIKEKIYDRWN